jgi:hypothetical protein
MISRSVNLPILTIHEGRCAVPKDILHFEDCMWIHPWSFGMPPGSDEGIGRDVTIVALEMATLVRDPAYVKFVTESLQ